MPKPGCVTPDGGDEERLTDKIVSKRTQGNVRGRTAKPLNLDDGRMGTSIHERRFRPSAPSPLRGSGQRLFGPMAGAIYGRVVLG
jgi:hypothetical protein